MKVIEPGHIYELDWLDGQSPLKRDGSTVVDTNRLVFVNRERGSKHAGTQTQEVIRALIDRTQHCDGCLRWEGNDKIVHHLRMALVLHEARAIERKTEKGKLLPEKMPVGVDGHFLLTNE